MIHSVSRAVMLTFSLCLAFPIVAADSSLPSDGEVVQARNEVLATIKENYVAPVDVDKLTQIDLKTLVREIDPESEYFDKKSVQELVGTKTEVATIGAEFNVVGDHLKIITLFDDCPATRAGLTEGDWVVRIDDMPVKGLTRSEGAKRLRGKPGTPVKLSVVRAGEAAPQDITVFREIVNQQSVKLRELGSGYGYVRISRFLFDTTATLVAKLRARYWQKSPKGLVIDLRDNSGGGAQWGSRCRFSIFAAKCACDHYC